MLETTQYKHLTVADMQLELQANFGYSGSSYG